ncbi:MAG: bifunctional riboflavin kinase/FAD synthetase [Nitrospirales bacterium]|nr:bifunctional riboflavin kinase/FAD synthetase [Nitrospirales bacterium]
MNISKGLPASPIPGSPVLTIGNFDGQHLGHQALLRAVTDRARKIHGVPTVLTFDPHPVQVLRPGSSHKFLSELEDKHAFFERLGIAELVILPFTPELAALLPSQFVETVLYQGLGIRKLIVGENFVFGKGRSGSIQDLTVLGKKAQFTVDPIPPVVVGQEIVSSTRIRNCLARGDVQEAAQCLGRFYRLGGRVISGERRGTHMGWPTANIRLSPHRVFPVDGIYATMAWIGGDPRPSVSYIGTRPTFREGERLLEVHIFDQNLQLYGQELHVEFVGMVRGDQAFSNVEDLLEQMNRDGECARRLLAQNESLSPYPVE